MTFKDYAQPSVHREVTLLCQFLMMLAKHGRSFDLKKLHLPTRQGWTTTELVWEVMFAGCGLERVQAELRPLLPSLWGGIADVPVVVSPKLDILKAYADEGLGYGHTYLVQDTRKMGFRPATTAEVLVYGALNPSVWEGSVTSYTDEDVRTNGHLCGIQLHRCLGKRSLDLPIRAGSHSTWDKLLFVPSGAMAVFVPAAFQAEVETALAIARAGGALALPNFK